MNIRRYKLGCRSQQNRHNLKPKSQSKSISSERVATQKNVRNIGRDNLKNVNLDDDNLILLTNENEDKRKYNRLASTESDREDDELRPYKISPSVGSTTLRSGLSGKISNTNTISSTTTSSTILVEHYSSSRQQHRKFNDLWVRLETVTTK